MKPVSFILTLFVSYSLTIPAYGQLFDELNYYQKGKTHIEQGQEDVGVRVWLQAYKVLREQDIHDPRIGFELIRQVTRLQAENLYQVASEAYFWGLNAYDASQWEDYLNEEVDYLKAIAEDDIYTHWKALIKDHDEAIFEELSEFWLQKNVVPSTPQNERLIEHWQRIHHAREHYTEINNTIYGTDDRGEIYVRYGPPTVEEKMMLHIDTGELRNKAYDLMEYGYIQSHSQVNEIAMTVAQSYTPQQLDFWRYDDIKPNEPVIFLFGRSGDLGRYGLRKKVEDFIPSNAFRTVVFGSRSGFRNIRAGNFLQFMLYKLSLPPSMSILAGNS